MRQRPGHLHVRVYIMVQNGLPYYGIHLLTLYDFKSGGCRFPVRLVEVIFRICAIERNNVHVVGSQTDLMGPSHKTYFNN